MTVRRHLQRLRGSHDPRPAAAITRDTVLFAVLVAFSVAVSVASTAGGSKLIQVPGGFAASATVFSFITLFAISNLINEYFRWPGAYLALVLGLAGNTVAALIYVVGINSPAAPFWSAGGDLDPQRAYAFVLGSAPRMFFAGACATLVSLGLNVYVFDRLRAYAPDSIWVRFLVGPVPCLALDTCVFVLLAFWDVGLLFDIFVGQFVIKTAFHFACYPVVYVAVVGIRKGLGIEPAPESEPESEPEPVAA